MEFEVLPHHEEYEHAVLGSVLAGEVAFEKVSGEISSAEFYSDKHRTIFRAMEEMHTEGVPIDLVTIHNHLTDTGEAERAGDSAYLTYLTQMSFHAPNVRYYIRAVKEAARKRDIWYAGHGVSQAVDSGKPIDEIKRLVEKLRTLTDGDSQGALSPVSASELPDLPPPESIWAELLYPGCLIQLNAEPGIGKSTFAYNVCALGALGKPFLEIAFAKQIKSLYVDLETPRQLRPNKIKLIAGELPPGFHLLDELELRRDHGDLQRLCEKEEYDLLVLDTQSRVFAMEQENDNSEANYYAGLLRRIASETNCAVLLIHHSTKGEGGKAVYRGRGASAIAGAVDIVLNMHTAAPDTLRLSVVKHRIQGSRPDIYMRKAGDDKFEVCDSPGSGGSEVENSIIELLSSSNESVQTNEIIIEMQYKHQAPKRVVERALQELSLAGKVLRVRKGHYTVADSDDPPHPPTLYPGGNGG